MALPLHLDHQATTPVDPRVVEAMAPFWSERFGHPSSPHHAYGWDAGKGLEDARARVAVLVGAEPREIVFTSGGTESDNLALRGVAEAYAGKGRHIVTTSIERSAVEESARRLEKHGFEVTRVGVDRDARLDLDALADALRDDTILVSVQWANHEVGTVQDVEAVGRLCAARGVLLHSDAAHAALWEKIDVQAAGLHLLSLSGHLLHGPKGIGALYVRRRSPRVRLAPLLAGGGQERGLRSGTPNVPGAVGLGRAAELVVSDRASDAQRVGSLRDALEAGLRERVEGLQMLGDAGQRLPNASAFAVQDVEGESLVLAASSVAFATGSACSSATLQPSTVLRAMGLDRRVADTVVRFGLGRFTTAEDVDHAVHALVDAVARIRASGTH